MSENPQPPEALAYQIVASRGEDGGQRELRARVTTRPLLIGSSKNASLMLDDPLILPVHMRALLSTTGQVVLTNLGKEGTVALNGEMIAPLVPTVWKPGLAVSVGEYTLELLTLIEESGSAQVERVRPEVITQNSEIVPDPDASIILSSLNPERSLEQSQLLQERPVISTIRPDDVFPPVAQPLPPAVNRTTPPPAAHTGQPAVSQTGRQPPAARTPLPTLDEDAGESRETEAIPVDLFQRGAGGANDTLRKNWQTANGLDAQLITNPVYLVAGERVRIPVSLRNQDTAPMKLRLHVAGLPKEWQVGADDVIQLAPGEIRSAGIVLQTQPSFMQSSIEAVIRVSDQERTDRFLMLPLNLNFKSAPNIVGKLAPERIAAPGTTYLTLHNHTLVPVTVFLTGHSPSADVRISPAQPQVQIPPGQFVEIPVRGEALRRRWFGAASYPFAVAVQQGQRATLDYPGTVRVRPRIPALPLVLLLLVIAAVIAFLALRNLQPASAVTSATSTTAPSPTASLQATTVLPASQAEVTPQIVQQPAASVTPAERSAVTRRAAPTDAPRTVAPKVVSTTALPPTQPPTTTPTLPPTQPLTSDLGVATVAPPDTPAQIVGNTPASPVGNCTAPAPPGWKPYTVKGGDTVFRLATRYGTTVDEVLRANCLADPRLLQKGQTILLPLP
jgi:LysM repeat protein